MPSLSWTGKEAVKAHLDTLPTYRLRRNAKLSCGDAGSGHVLIEGDNLQALKALLPDYRGRIKCIYIDPPYNTGSEAWLYNDNVKGAAMRAWLDQAVGSDSAGLDKHERWLCMMYPRLLLLRQLLRDDGVLLVSIDDGEVHHLRALLDEIFGAAAHLTTFVWRTAGNFDNQAKIKHCHEYVLAYTPRPALFVPPRVIDPAVAARSKLRREFIQNTIVKNGPKNPCSEITLPAGFPASVAQAHIPARDDRWPHFREAAEIVDGRLLKPVRVVSGWSSKAILEAFIAAGFTAVPDSREQPTRFVITARGAIESIKPRGSASHVVTVLNELGSTQAQSAALAAMGLKFPFPKPLKLIKYLVSLIDDRHAIVLDCFAGSGTTAHAVLELNAADGGQRRCLLVEMDARIARQVTAPRWRQVIAGHRDAQGRPVAGVGGGFDYCQLLEVSR